MSTPRSIAIIIGSALGGLLGVWHELGAAGLAASPPSQQAQPVDRAAWARKLARLDEADWGAAFKIGQELADLPAEEGFAILRANWEKVDSVNARLQLLRGWAIADPNSMRWREHPRLLDGLDLGMRDRSPEVQVRALQYLNGLAFQDFSEDFRAYKVWFEASRGRPVAEVVAASARRFAAEAAHSVKSVARKRAQWLAGHQQIFQQFPEARRAALDAGLARTLARWAAGAANGSPPEDIMLAVQAVYALNQLRPGEAELRRVVVPLLSKDTPPGVRGAAIAVLGARANTWAIDLLLDLLEDGLEEVGPDRLQMAHMAAGALANIGDAQVIPRIIALLVAHDSPRTIEVAAYGLRPLTGVSFDPSHDGAWWRAWWEKNREKYPEAVRSLEIPDPPEGPRGEEEAPAAAGLAATAAGIVAQDLRAGRDEKKRYFLIGAKDAKPPAAGYGLLIVLPGGDGSAEFLPFVRRIREQALDDRWIIAQAVAPKWDDDQFKRVVWPTDGLPYLAARFTTEEFLRAIIADVRAKVKIDPRRVFLLGWSSGGPPCYATALDKDSGVAAAFVAMSTFKPGQLPPLENARGKAFFLLQSPQDRVTPIRRAEAAETALRAAGAKVRLRRYEGGHGWRGDVWTMIRDGIAWLDQQVGAE